MKKLVAVMLLGLTMILAACAPAETNTASPAALSLTATDLAFDTTRIEVVAGQPVKLTLHNEGALEHDFSILEMPHDGEIMVEEMDEIDGEMAGHDMNSMSEQPEIHMAALPGGSSTIEFTPSEPGEYLFYCAVAGHKEAGMTGTLVVKAP